MGSCWWKLASCGLPVQEDAWRVEWWSAVITALCFGGIVLHLFLCTPWLAMIFSSADKDWHNYQKGGHWSMGALVMSPAIFPETPFQIGFLLFFFRFCFSSCFRISWFFIMPSECDLGCCRLGGDLGCVAFSRVWLRCCHTTCSGSLLVFLVVIQVCLVLFFSVSVVYSGIWRIQVGCCFTSSVERASASLHLICSLPIWRLLFSLWTFKLENLDPSNKPIRSAGWYDAQLCFGDWVGGREGHWGERLGTSETISFALATMGYQPRTSPGFVI